MPVAGSSGAFDVLTGMDDDYLNALLEEIEILIEMAVFSNAMPICLPAAAAAPTKKILAATVIAILVVSSIRGPRSDDQGGSRMR